MGMTQTESLPRTIRNLITETEAIGGEVTEVAERLFRFYLPCRVVGGKIKLVMRAQVGYYVREDGKNVIRGVAALRSEIAYWTKQSGR